MSNLSLCSGPLNGIWSTTQMIPPSATTCSDNSNCNIGCSVSIHGSSNPSGWFGVTIGCFSCVSVCPQTNDDCPGGPAGSGFCYGNVCRCHKYWFGPGCDFHDTVPLPYCDGFRDSKGECCHGTSCSFKVRLCRLNDDCIAIF